MSARVVAWRLAVVTLAVVTVWHFGVVFAHNTTPHGVDRDRWEQPAHVQPVQEGGAID